MNIWHLPGPSEYLNAVERSLRDGESVVLRFPKGAPTGFERALQVQLADCWRWVRVEVSPSTEVRRDEPLRHLFDQFAPELSTVSDLTPVDLCEAEGFLGRLIWIEGLRNTNCPEWMMFLENYAQASRSVSRLKRTLFVAPVGTETSGASPRHVALTVHDWAEVVDEMDLAFLANDRLRARGVGETLRKLLVMTIAQVAAWDCAVAERLADASIEDILDPLELLRSEARKRGWTRETPPRVSLGTASVLGVVHAALAAIREPDEIRRRVWNAQVSVLLPMIEMQRREIIREHFHQITAELRRTGRATDTQTLEIGELAFLFRQAGFDQQAGSRVEKLRLARNELAHSRPLLVTQALGLVRVAAEVPLRSW